MAVGIVMTEGEEVADLRRWTSVDRDVRRDPAIAASILEFIAQFEVRTVVMTDRIIGCPHEEGIDYEDRSALIAVLGPTVIAGSGR